MTQTIEEIAQRRLNEPVNSPVILDDIQQHLETLNLDPIDAIYVQSNWFTDLYNLGLEELVHYADQYNISLFRDSNPTNVAHYYRILRTVIYYIDEEVKKALVEYNTPNVRCRERDPDTGDIIDIITMKKINPYRMISIPEPDGVHGNCFDIISITEWLNRDTGYVDDLGGKQPVGEYRNPATNAVISRDVANQILSNDKAWWVAVLEDFKKDIPYIPEPMKPHKYQQLYDYTYHREEYLNIQKLKYNINNNDIEELTAEWGHVNHQDSRGYTLLDLVIMYSKRDTPYKISYLIRNGAKVNPRDRRSPLIIAVVARNTEAVKELLRNGADINNEDPRTRTTALIESAGYEGHEEIMRMLINSGARLDIQDNNGVTALINAAKPTGATDKLRLLIDAGAQLDIQDENGNTALIIAVDHYDDTIYDEYAEVEMLIEAGANLDIRNNWGETALMMARYNDELEIMLLDAGAR